MQLEEGKKINIENTRDRRRSLPQFPCSEDPTAMVVIYGVPVPRWTMERLLIIKNM